MHRTYDIVAAATGLIDFTGTVLQAQHAPTQLNSMQAGAGVRAAGGYS